MSKMLITSDQLPSLRAQAEHHFVHNPDAPLRFEISDATKDALRTHAPAAWSAWNADGDFSAAARLDLSRLYGVTARGEKLSEGGREALESLEAMLIAEQHNASRRREIETATGEPAVDVTSVVGCEAGNGSFFFNSIPGRPQ